MIDTMVLKHLMHGQITPAEALESGAVTLHGDPALLHQFVELFHIPAAPVPSEGLAVR